MNDQEKAFMIHVALGALDAVRESEPERSARRVRLEKAQERIVDLIDIYRPTAWPNAMMIRAGELVDRFNVQISAEFGAVQGLDRID